ncbi:4Fe-4S dicluster domain-containing protein [Bacillus sp. DTU_2020_1000418_1_SI_GHA_SEK_038]|uniref:4Fe-4S dicluster domain-containing protein n=1 Tax=Bacillus sp. DTU_2020_1000418_1_SI_GHA_SEK_038 TaxID=3077585 RepID=UPI0028E4E09A|nr:4Fe-4S dicluster domain-containing protein [Bacillus sp. DTU_2020_1000418_1_SI_GHA_SEK_038]WNS74068.1 4Fe-4S dicluster domain-containing protein [Bacillus sp. DTU_2020_1000418_1_SI_GHA_SEK_038]
MAKKMGFVVNIDRCIGCHACEVTCKSFYQLEPEVSRRRVRQLPETIAGVPTRAYLSMACNHCDMPACRDACPVGAYTKREDGIVIHNQDLCIGCQMCGKACPYSVPQYDPVKKKMNKCSMCFERLDAGELPICVQNCPLEAIQIVDLNEPQYQNLAKTVPGFPDPSITQPNIRFILPKAGKQVRSEANA